MYCARLKPWTIEAVKSYVELLPSANAYIISPRASNVLSHQRHRRDPNVGSSAINLENVACLTSTGSSTKAQN